MTMHETGCGPLARQLSAQDLRPLLWRRRAIKAVVIHALGGPDQLTLAEMPDPVPGAGEVLLDVAYAGCNWVDTQVRMGIYPHPAVRLRLTAQDLRDLSRGDAP
jgi:hypothetical protein